MLAHANVGIRTATSHAHLSRIVRRGACDRIDVFANALHAHAECSNEAHRLECLTIHAHAPIVIP